MLCFVVASLVEAISESIPVTVINVVPEGVLSTVQMLHVMLIEMLSGATRLDIYHCAVMYTGFGRLAANQNQFVRTCAVSTVK